MRAHGGAVECTRAMGGTVGCHGGGMGNPSSDTPEHLHDLTAIKHFPCPTPMVNRCRWLQVSCEHALVVPAISGTQLPCSEGTRVATNVLCTLRMQYKLHTANPELSAASDVCIWCKRSDNGVAPHTRKLQPTPLPINGKNYSFFLLWGRLHLIFFFTFSWCKSTGGAKTVLTNAQRGAEAYISPFAYQQP